MPYIHSPSHQNSLEDALTKWIRKGKCIILSEYTHPKIGGLLFCDNKIDFFHDIHPPQSLKPISHQHHSHSQFSSLPNGISPSLKPSKERSTQGTHPDTYSNRCSLFIYFIWYLLLIRLQNRMVYLFWYISHRSRCLLIDFPYLY